jgi:excisionase family DNA binding protein
MMDNPFSEIERRFNRIESLLIELRDSHYENSEKDKSGEFLSIKQASEFLNLAVPTLYSLVSKNEIPVNKKGKRLYFNQEELIHWIKQGKRPLKFEIKRDVQHLLKRKGVNS